MVAFRQRQSFTSLHFTRIKFDLGEKVRTRDEGWVSTHVWRLDLSHYLRASGR